MIEARLALLHRLLEAAKRLADPRDPLGQEARSRLPALTGLSPQGVDLALTEHLEHRVHRAQMRDMCNRFPQAPRAHVLLSANVFIGAFRAIAIALAQSESVYVRPSRRESVFAELLHRGSGEAFLLASELSPAPGDHVWAYGTDETLKDVVGRLPAGVTFHGKGAGMGAVLVAPSGVVKESQLEPLCDALVRDVVPFDQRGCLSPRVVLLHASRSFAETFTDCLAERLELAGRSIPRGQLSREESAELLRYEQTMLFVGGLRQSPHGSVALDPKSERLYLPPAGRTLHVTVTQDPLTRFRELAPRLTTVGLSVGDQESAHLRALLPGRRLVDLGQMQHPAFDGPVDLRTA